jgi:hypothetical protein
VAAASAYAVSKEGASAAERVGSSGAAAAGGGGGAEGGVAWRGAGGACLEDCVCVCVYVLTIREVLNKRVPSGL